jgi:transcriptional regulator GlxA family with amidase domain
MSDGSDVARTAVDHGEPCRDESPSGRGFVARAANDAQPPEVGRGGLPGWRLRRVVDFMTENMARDIDVDELVTRCGLSRAQFFRAFRQSTGQTPHRYLVGLRLERARALLETTGLAVAEVTQAVGMGSNAGFARLFQQRFGEQPARYRRGFQAAKVRRANRELLG